MSYDFETQVGLIEHVPLTDSRPLATAVSIVIPAYNEADHVADEVHAVRGVINKMGRRRQDLDRAERQIVLDEWKVARLDDGMLPDSYFVAQAVASDRKPKKKLERPTAPAAKESPPDPKTRAGRLEIKRRKREEKRREALAAAEAARRAEGLAPSKGAGSALR